MSAPGYRIRQARLWSGCTQTELAKAFGISQASWARIELGQKDPPIGLTRWLANRTGMAESFFTRSDEPPILNEGTLRFREHSRLTKRERSRATAIAQVAFEILQNARDEGVSLPELRLPLPSATHNAGPEAAASLAREALGLGHHEPIPHLTRAMERAGVRVFVLPVKATEARRAVDAFSCWAGLNLADPVVSFAEDAPGDRLRWSLAHELGHLVMHVRMPGETMAEQEAHAFAGALLMPAESFVASTPPTLSLRTLGGLKEYWRVSMAAVIMRAAELELIDEGHKTRLFRLLSRRGWRGREPIEIPAERPRLLRTALEALHGKPLDIVRAAKAHDVPPPLLSRLVVIDVASRREAGADVISMLRRG